MNAEEKAKANAEMAKSSGQATKEAAPPQGHGQPGDSKSTFQKLKETAKQEKPSTR